MSRLAAVKAVVRGVRKGRLTAADCRLLACVRVLQAVAFATLACRPLPAARRALAQIRPLASAWCGAIPEARIIWAFEASAYWRIGRARCLARALAAEVLLPATDRPVMMIIGITPPTNGLLKSHAWIERDGSVLVGGSESRRQYLPFVAWNSSTK
jgi:transglutaminase superfamily protein